MDASGFDFSALGLYRERLCLDFANTTPSHTDLSEDHLRTYADLLSWAREVELLSADEAAALQILAGQQPEAAAAALRKAVELREASFALLSDTAAGRPLRPEALAEFNALLAEALPHLRVAPAEAGLRWTWAGEPGDLECVLWPVAWSVVEFLTSDDRKYLRECAAETCEWLFLDLSRNHSRRWCSMQTCGNRAKARRHYERGRSEAGSD